MKLRYSFLTNWTEADLQTLPPTETSEFEYKGSRVPDNELADKISKAASAFWNSGGGVLVIGVNNNGIVDGGVSNTVGRQSRQDWVERIISKVSPTGKYSLKPIPPQQSNSLIQPSNVVVVIGFEESLLAPHMADDKRYYVRAGTHSDPATHFLVEAIRSRKSVQTPIIRAILQNSEKKASMIELAIIVLNDASVLDAEISFDPLPVLIQENIKDSIPLRIPVIDRQHPFSMELFRMLLKSQLFGEVPVLLKMDYEDALENKYHYEQLIDPDRNRLPISIGHETLQTIEEAIKEVSQNIKYLNEIVEATYRNNFPPKQAKDLSPDDVP